MEILKYYISLFYLLILFVFSLFLKSCQILKDDPLYVGTWQFKERIITNDLTYSTTRTLILTRTTYEEVFVIQRENSGLVSGIFGTKGKLAFSRLYMTFKLEGLGTCVRDASDACTEDIEWFGDGTRYWSDNFQYFEISVKGEFEADELSLRLKRDLNNDHDLEDTGEDVEFTRI
jgi:hypothetical protein